MLAELHQCIDYRSLRVAELLQEAQSNSRRIALCCKGVSVFELHSFDWRTPYF